MNQKGFTLVELIVTIAIIGIISGIAYGSITQLQLNNRKRKYEAYEQVMITGAQLYVDQYSRDLWTNSNDTTSYCISYSTLLDQNLIQAYNEKNESLNTSISKVLVTRNKGQNSFKPYIVVKSVRGNELYKSSTSAPSCANNR